MKAFFFTFLFLPFVFTASAQEPSKKKLVITGVRFAYPLVQQWIDEYKKVAPGIDIVIESRTTTDPTRYDLLIEAYEQEESVKLTREYLYIARYALVPIANSQSSFAKNYGDRGLDKELIKQIYFHDLYADKKKAQEIKAPYTVYTRLQRAGAPVTFAGYYGFEQKDIKGKAIAGADEHLIKALLRDSTGISYSPLSLIYDRATGKVTDGIAIIPVDLNGNGKVNNDEKIYSSLTNVLEYIEHSDEKGLVNLPVGDIHLSVSKQHADPEAVKFLQWLILNGQNSLHAFGYLQANPARFQTQKQKFEQLVSGQ